MTRGLVCVLSLTLCIGTLGCVDQFEVPIKATVDVIVVEATLTDLPEPQIVRLNRSKADPFTGRFGNTPIKQATIAVEVAEGQLVYFKETEPGRYEGPINFRGKAGQAYRLRFWLIEGQAYESDTQVLPHSVPIDRITEAFDPKALPLSRPDGITNLTQGANNLFVDFTDPAAQRNYYQWEWRLWEKQEFCKSCTQGWYSVYTITNPLAYLIDYNICYQTNSTLFEECYFPPTPPYGAPKPGFFYNDYRCRTSCWAILYSYAINLFDDQYSNGGQISHQQVAQIPFHQPGGALAEIRQSCLTPDAYRYAKQLQEQTQNNGGVADTPPALPIGNIHNVTNPDEIVVGYFSATGVTAQRYWIDRKQNVGPYSGLFQALNGRDPSEERARPSFCTNKPFTTLLDPRVPTAVCFPKDTQTPLQPQGWLDN